MQDAPDNVPKRSVKKERDKRERAGYILKTDDIANQVGSSSFSPLPRRVLFRKKKENPLKKATKYLAKKVNC